MHFLKFALLSSLAFCAFSIGLLVLAWFMPKSVVVTGSPNTGYVYWGLVAVATVLPMCLTVFVSDILLVTCNILHKCGVYRAALFLNFLASSAAHVQNPFFAVPRHPRLSLVCSFLLVLLFGASQLLTAANGRYVEVTLVQNATISAVGSASSFGGCTGVSCELTSNENFPMMVKELGGITASTFAYQDTGGTFHYPVWPDPTEINRGHNYKFERMQGVHSAQYNLSCSKGLAPDAQFEGADNLVNDTQVITVKSSAAVTSDGVLQSYFGMHFLGVEGYTYYSCSLNASKELVDVVWSSTGGVLKVINVTNFAPYTGSWVGEVTKPLTSLALVFSNTLSWWFTGHFTALTSQQAKDDAILRVAHAFTQTLLLRNSQTTDDTYINQAGVSTDTWWQLKEIKPQRWFLVLLIASAILGVVSCLSVGLLFACVSRFGARPLPYTGQWRPVQLDGPEAIEGADAPAGGRLNTESELWWDAVQKWGPAGSSH